MAGRANLRAPLLLPEAVPVNALLDHPTTPTTLQKRLGLERWSPEWTRGSQREQSLGKLSAVRQFRNPDRQRG